MKVKHKRFAREWLRRAESDWQYAKAGEKETGQHHVTCFLCHQAVEKVLKGLITGAGKSPQKTHNLRTLLSKVQELFPATDLEDSDVRRLDTFYIPSRYPGPIENEFTAKDARTALKITARFIEVAQAVIK